MEYCIGLAPLCNWNLLRSSDYWQVDRAYTYVFVPYRKLTSVTERCRCVVGKAMHRDPCMLVSPPCLTIRHIISSIFYDVVTWCTIWLLLTRCVEAVECLRALSCIQSSSTWVLEPVLHLSHAIYREAIIGSSRIRKRQGDHAWKAAHG
jgi:hypothetical protein